MVVNRTYHRAQRVVVLVALFAFLLLMFVVNNGEAQGQGREIEAQLPGDTDTQTLPVDEFAESVYEDINDFWERGLRSQRLSYSPPRGLVIVGDRPARTRCQEPNGSPVVVQPKGMPMYCPADQYVYFPLNATFTDPNSNPKSPNRTQLRLDEQEDFAIAVTLAHEMGHHLQHELYNDADLQTARSIDKELQADCFAGMWATVPFDNRQLEHDDLEEAVVTLYFVGDPPDVAPFDPQAHGKYEQRINAFAEGFVYGNFRNCLGPLR
jgi:predicted metalloprotease